MPKKTNARDQIIYERALKRFERGLNRFCGGLSDILVASIMIKDLPDTAASKFSRQETAIIRLMERRIKKMGPDMEKLLGKRAARKAMKTLTFS